MNERKRTLIAVDLKALRATSEIEYLAKFAGMFPIAEPIGAPIAAELASLAIAAAALDIKATNEGFVGLKAGPTAASAVETANAAAKQNRGQRRDAPQGHGAEMRMTSMYFSRILSALGVSVALTLNPAVAQPAATSAQTTAAQYRLALGDTVKITVFQAPDLSLESRITEAGVISYPLLGSVNLAGLTVSEAEQRIAKGLRDGNFVRAPQVSISIVQARGNQVSVLGQVGKPGRYALETGEVRLTDMLATAGGVVQGGSDTVVVVGTRNGQPYRVEIDLPGVFGPNHRGADVLLQNGDVIWVERTPTVYMYGEVQRPGALRLERSMTVMQALASAGGLTQRGTLRGLRVSRKDNDGRTREIEPQMTDVLRPDDVVFVRESVF